MSLQVWLPLNGDLHNQGLSNVTVTNNGATVSNDGKIGKCYEFDGNTNYISISSTELFNCFKGGSTQFSIAMWVYNGEISGSRAVLFGDYGTTGAINSNIEINGINKNDSARFYWGYGNVNWGASNSILTVNSWTHLVVTYDGTKLNIYINGVLTDTKTTTLSTLSKTTGAFYLGRDNRTGATAFKGKLNDFRVYDHCLSPKEVKEISQGLVLHYPLNDVSALMSKCSNITWNQLAGIYVNNRPTEVSVTNNNGKTRITITSFTSSSTRYIETTLNSYRTIVGHKYYIGCPCYFTGGFYARYNIGNGWKTLSTSNGNPISRVELCETAYTMANTSLGILNQTSPGVGDYAEFYGNYAFKFIDLTQMFGAGNEPTVEEFELMFPLPYYPYDAGTVKDLTLPLTDCSGYNYNGTITGTLTLDSNTPRYEYSTYFNGSSYINTLPGELEWTNFEIITISAWIKPTTTPSSYSGSIGIGHEGSGSYKTFAICNSKGKFTVNLSNGNYVFVYSDYVCPLNEWHHYCATLNGTELKMYVDGELIKTHIVDWGTAALYPRPQFQVGVDLPGTDETYTGYYSDVRIYSTALSDQDILDLYNISAYIDNGQNLHCYEFVEDDVTSPEIEKTGIVKTQEFNEFPDDVVLYDYIESTGTQYIDTNFNPNNNTRVVTEFMPISDDNAKGFFGAYPSNNFSTATYGLYYSSTAVYAYSNYQSDTAFNRNTYLLHDVKHKVDKNKNLLYIDNNLVLTHTAATFQSSISMHVFKLNFTSYPRYAKMKLYYFKIYDNDVLVRDYLPCTKNGEAGLWDRVNNQFYGNSGTGTFTLGNPIQTVTSLYQDKINTKQLIEQ